MLQSRQKIYSIILALFLLFPSFNLSAMTKVSDRISLSWPGAGSNHTITFLTTLPVPAGGRIEIVPEDGEFFIFDGFDYTDVDLATAATAEGPWTDRSLSSSTSAAEDGVAVVSSTTSGSVNITMNSGQGIPAGTYVQIELGTQASFGEIGDRQIINSSTNGTRSIMIRQYDASGVQLKKSNVKIAILEPVSLNGSTEKRRMFAAPIGWLAYGTTETILSIYTNFGARCRFSTASGTPYAAMTETFQYASSTLNYFYHNAGLSGLSSGGQYEYFVRCIDENGLVNDLTKCQYEASTTPYHEMNGDPITEVDCIDYYIPFRINGFEGEGGTDTGGEEGSGNDGGGGSSSGGGGSGGGAGGGSGNERGRQRSKYLPYPPLPGAPGVIFTGWGYASQDVIVLQDGAEVGYTTTNPKAEFGAFLADLKQGVYTFTLYTQDPDGRKSANHSATFWIDDGTQTTLADIILPPTIAIDNSNPSSGGSITAQGYTMPLGRIELWAYPLLSGAPDQAKLIEKEAVANDAGQWSLLVDFGNLASGKYYVQARAKKEGLEESGWSQALEVSLGAVKAPAGACAGADLNGDGRVNLTDFSILLYHWGTGNECADQNKDGTVNLIDFSIIMYNWTG